MFPVSENDKEKTPLLRKMWVANKMLFYVTSEGAVSHNVLYFQQLSIARYQVSFVLTIIWSNYQ